jgi:hypothetical protein
MSRESCPDLIGGCPYGRTVAPDYIDLSNDDIRRLHDPAPHVHLTELLVSRSSATTTRRRTKNSGSTKDTFMTGSPGASRLS